MPASPAQSLRPAVARIVPIRLVGEDTAEVVRGQGGLGEGEGDQTAQESGLVVLRRSFEQAVEGRQRAGRFPGLQVRIGQEPGCIGIARTPPEQMLEIGDRFGPLLLLGVQPAAVDQGFRIVRNGREAAVHLGQFGGVPRLGIDDFADDSYRPRRGHRTDGVPQFRGRRIRRRVPVQPQDAELVTDLPQVPHQHGLLVRPGDELRAVGAEDDRSRGHRLQGRQSCQLASRGGIGQQDLIRRNSQGHQPAVAGERRAVHAAPLRSGSIRGPGSQVPAPEMVITQARIGDRARNQPAPVGAEADEVGQDTDRLLRPQDALEPAPAQVPNPNTGLLSSRRPPASGHPG